MLLFRYIMKSFLSERQVPLAFAHGYERRTCRDERSELQVPLAIAHGHERRTCRDTSGLHRVAADTTVVQGCDASKAA